MNKITKKLFRYFTVLALFLVTIVFIGFYSVFRYYNYRYQEDLLKERAETIKNQLEAFTNATGHRRGQGAYLRFLDDISMAVIALIRAGAVFRFLYCMIRLESAEEEQMQYRKRAKNTVLFYVLAESVWQIREIVFFYYGS